MTRQQLLETSFLSGANPGFLADLYRRYLADRNSVDASWVHVFDEMGPAERAFLDEIKGPSWARTGNGHTANGHGAAGALAAGTAAVPAPAEAGISAEDAARDAARAFLLIRAYRVRGHLLANFDPLGLEKRAPYPELDPATYGFTEADMDRPIYIDNVFGKKWTTLAELLTALRETYCGKIGIEYMHMQAREERAWIQDRIEGIRNHTDFTPEGKRAILERLTAAEVFEQFLDRKYTGTKRFGLEGGEALIPALEQVIKRGGQLGVREIVLGMAHRGRLNVLANFMGKPFAAIFSEFQGNPANPEDVQGSGDVKYHLGTSSDREFGDISVHLSLTANPSHLEAVDPVVVGKVRAKQTQRGDLERNQVLGVLLHGDAAFAGQGLVAETLELSHLVGYRTGGTVHFIINNQIGFTTAPAAARSSPYPTDVAKSVQAPIFHVNGDDPEAVVHISRVAIEYRHRFHKDVVVDIFCYRRHGHNEGDEPAFTQPVMYRAIKAHPTTRQIYATRLQDEGTTGPGEDDDLVAQWNRRLEADFEAAKTYKPNKADWLEGAWTGFSAAPNDDWRGETAVSLDLLRDVGAKLAAVPEGFAVHPRLARVLERRVQTVAEGRDVDWATAELLAYGTLLAEGSGVRLSGQDCGRGTFSQRHAVLVDQNTGQRHVPLSHLAPNQGHFEIFDSPLSEMAVLGFEYGYSLAEPRSLVLWEAQFGDFANGAQVILDQFISSGEAKWLRMSGLVMLLPHGYEGQGPEHSSARLERYLQLCAEDNMQVVTCTTPANHFHALRRQIRRNFRKPLIVMSPKSLLRHKLCVSGADEFGPGSAFHRVIGEIDALAPVEKIRRVVLCSGKVYYDLLTERRERKIDDVAIVRLEQLYPFPARALAAELKRYPKADVIWCQEEPENMGAWHLVDRRIESVLEEIGHSAKRPVYAGRPESAATATGSFKRHNEQQARLVAEALGT